MSHFARAERLDLLRDLVLDRVNYTTQVVREEMRTGAELHRLLLDALDLEWLEVLALDTLDEVKCFAKWINRLGAGKRDVGESSVFAAAELRNAIAITDDGDARRVGRRYGLEIHGTIWLLASACRGGKLTEVAAGNLVEALRSTGMRLPCTGPEFGSFAHGHGLL